MGSLHARSSARVIYGRREVGRTSLRVLNPVDIRPPFPLSLSLLLCHSSPKNMRRIKEGKFAIEGRRQFD